jgi:hypothetical protein
MRQSNQIGPVWRTVLYIVWIAALNNVEAEHPTIINARVVVTLSAALPLLIVVIGFFFRLPSACGVLLPPLVDGQHAFSLDGIPAQNFPLGVAYRVQMRNLWLLAAAPLISYGVWAAVGLHWVMSGSENPLPAFFSIALSAIAFYIAMRWLHERRILKGNCSGLARIQSIVKSEARYEFFDHRGDRRGGMQRFFGHLDATNPAPIMIDVRNPDNSRLYLSFWFHYFRVAGARHVPLNAIMRQRAS